MPKPMGRVMRDEQRRIMDDGTLNFHKQYKLFEMTNDELVELEQALVDDARQLRKRQGRDREFPKKLYLARLRQAQAKAVRAYHRQTEEIQI